ncbi:GGDEF domain-containing protein [Crocosphaera sp. Alani8]|uniref:GGDEF domain-containing protein n=1 Tax=Crocosphaera sp. Alani8 TaxID=3038952 RepID=UPI00313C384C
MKEILKKCEYIWKETTQRSTITRKIIELVCYSIILILIITSYSVLSLKSFKSELLNSIHAEIVQINPNNDIPNALIVEQLLEQDENFNHQENALFHSIVNLNEEKIKLTQKHEEIFLRNIIILAMTAILLSVLLSLKIIVRIRNNIFRLSTKISEVTQAIVEDKVLISEGLTINSSDEFTNLSDKIIEMIDVLLLDIERRKKLEQDLEKLATIDELTGAFNRKKWEEMLNIEIERTHRNEQNLSLIIFDIDFFKSINDTYGHDTGDLVLREVVTTVKKEIRTLDFLCRIGGEEFAILCPDTNHNQVINLAERVRESIENYYFSQVDKVTISLGVSQFKTSDDKSKFIKRADLALYKSKRNGRNQVNS